MEDKRSAYRMLVERPERTSLVHLGPDGRIILKWISKHGMESYGLD
jgi:hypothetical protein